MQKKENKLYFAQFYFLKFSVVSIILDLQDPSLNLPLFHVNPGIYDALK